MLSGSTPDIATSWPARNYMIDNVHTVLYTTLYMMKRTTVFLKESQVQILAAMSVQSGVSTGELIRKAIDLLISDRDLNDIKARVKAIEEYIERMTGD